METEQNPQAQVFINWEKVFDPSLQFLQDPKEAIEMCQYVLKKAYSLPENHNQHIFIAMTHLRLAKKYRIIGKLDLAIKELQKGINILSKSAKSDNAIMFVLFYEICCTLSLQEKWEELLIPYKDAFKFYGMLPAERLAEHMNQWAELKKIVARANFNLGLFDLCKKNALQAIEQFRMISPTEYQLDCIECFQFLIVIYMEVEDWDRYTESIDELIKLASACPNPSSAFKDLTGFLFGKLQEAAIHFGPINVKLSRKCFGIYVRLEKVLKTFFAGRTYEDVTDEDINDGDVDFAWQQVARAYEAMDKWDRSLEIMLEVVKSLPKDSFLAELSTNEIVVILLFHTDRYAEAEPFIEILKGNLSKYNNEPNEVIFIKSRIAEYYLRMGQYEESLKYQCDLPVLKERNFEEFMSRFKKAINYYCCEREREALEATKEALEIWEYINVHDSAMQSHLKNSLKKLIEDKRTNKYVQKIFEDILSSTNNEAIHSAGLRFLFACYFEQENYDRCIECFEKTMSLPSIPKVENKSLEAPLVSLLDERSFELISTLMKNNENNEIESKKLRLMYVIMKAINRLPQEKIYLVHYYSECCEKLLEKNDSNEAKILLARTRLSSSCISILFDVQSSCLAIECLGKAIEVFKAEEKEKMYLCLSYIELVAGYKRIMDHENHQKVLEEIQEVTKEITPEDHEKLLLIVEKKKSS